VISGKMPGAEFANTKQGIVMKQQKRPRGLSSNRIARQRQVWDHRSDLWNALTPDEVKQWEVAAPLNPRTNRLGQRTYLSPRALFMSNLIDCTLTAPIPDYTEVPDRATLPIDTFTATIYEGGPYLIDLHSPDHSTTILLYTLWIGRYFPASTNPKPKRWINVGTYQHSGDPSTWYHRFWHQDITFAEGERIAIKARPHVAWYWPGQEVTLFATVEGLYESPSVRWAMDDRTNTATIRDSAGSNPQTFIDATGNPFTQKHSVAGYNGPALEFDGVDDHIDLTDASNQPFLAKDQNFTISFWWKCNSPGAAVAKQIVSNYIYPAAGFRVATVSNKFRMTFTTVFGGVPRTVEWISTPNIDNDWHFWTIARDDTTIDFYQDAVLVNTDTDVHNNEALYTPGTPLCIAHRPSLATYSPGQMQDFRIYNKYLDAAQVADLYNV
jgi:hypothetical protein